jgi:Tfp pilus assembly protein PilV
MTRRSLIGISRKRPRHGLGLVELLAALIISAGLLTATAVAIHTSFNAYRINQQQSILLQSARIALYRVTANIRQSALHAPDTAALSTQFASGATVSDTGIKLYDPNNNLIIYRLDTANNRLLVIANGTSYPLLEGVEAFSVTMEPMRSSASVRTGGNWDLLKRATLFITVKTNSKTSGVGEGTGSFSLTLSASTMPRRNAW